MGSVSEMAFNRLMDAAKEAVEVYKGPLGAVGARERAECYRHATGALTIAIEGIIEKGDRLRPAFVRWNNATRKIMGDNPGTIYDAAYIDAGKRYRLSGVRGTPTYLGICVYGTDEDGDRRIVNNIDDSEISFAADGSFEVVLSANKPDEDCNWLQLKPDATDIMVRQYFLQRALQTEATYDIESLDAVGPPEPLTEEEFAARCDWAATFLRECLIAELTVSALSASTTPQQLRDGDTMEVKNVDEEAIDMRWVSKLMPSPSILYSGSWVNELGSDEVLIVEGRPPRARYWSIQVLSRWMESIDWRYHNAIFTDHNTELEPDGSFRIVLAHVDPGEKNWLETAGLTSCNVVMRAIQAEDDDLVVDFRREKRRST